MVPPTVWICYLQNGPDKSPLRVWSGDPSYFSLPLSRGVAKAALYCAHRIYVLPPSSLVISQGWGLIDLPLRASNEGSPRPRVARAQKSIRLHPVLCSASKKGTWPLLPLLAAFFSILLEAQPDAKQDILGTKIQRELLPVIVSREVLILSE